MKRLTTLVFALLLASGCSEFPNNLNDSDMDSDGGGQECEAHSAGSCVTAENCTNFDGPFFSPSNSAMFCDGEFNRECACPESQATGKCVVFKGSANQSTEVYSIADPSQELRDCLAGGEFNEWQSTANTPDLSGVCLRVDGPSQASRGDGALWETCTRGWTCGPEANGFEVSCEQEGAADTPYTCTCTDASGTTEFTAQATDAPCGSVGDDDAAKDAAFGRLEALVQAECGWSVSGE